MNREERKQIVKDNYMIMRTKDIAKMIKGNTDTVARFAKELGIYIPMKDRVLFSDVVNVNYFDNWSSDMAYLLGFIIADGSISIFEDRGVIRQRLNISNTDYDLMSWVAKELGGLKIYTRKRKEGDLGKKDLYRIETSNKTITSKLMELGVIPNKTEYMEVFPEVPLEYRIDFLRGFFDGDGSVSVSEYKPTGKKRCHVRFYCTVKPCLDYFRDYLSSLDLSLNIKELETNKGFKYWYIQLWKEEDINKLYLLMYSKGSICMKRKKLEFERFVKPRSNGEGLMG